MPPKRKRPPSRPPEDPSMSAPPSRRAKMVAKDSITVQLASEQNGRSVLTSPFSNGTFDTTLDVKGEKTEPLEAGPEGSGGSNSDVCAICLAPSGSVRVDRSSELSKANDRLVNEISKLEMLKRDVTTRGDLVGNIVFRSLIYKDKLEWSSIDRNAIRRKPTETKEDYARGRDAVVREIILWCSESQINSPQFSRNLRLVGIFPGYLDRFQSELFEFASSMLSLRDFDRTSAYSSPELRQTLHRRNRRGNSNQEVVMLSDSDSDSGVIALDNARNYGPRSDAGDDVIVLSDNNQTDDEPTRGRGESNYVRDEATSSNSEASNAEDLYARPACLLPRYPFLPHAGPLHVVDAFGSSRDLFQHLFTPFFSRSEHQHFLRSLGMSSAPVENDTTIVLSSDDENDRSPTTGFDGHSRRTGSSRSGQGSSSSQDTITPNNIAWLSPTNHSNRPGTSPIESQVLPSSSSSANARPLQPSEAPRKPKSLFVPGSAKGLLPKGPIEVKGENKLLAALWQERRNRYATTGRILSDEASTSATNANVVSEDQKVGIVSADRELGMENEVMDCAVSQNLNDDAGGSTIIRDNTSAHLAMPGSSVGSSGDSIVELDVPLSLSKAEEGTIVPGVGTLENVQGEREKRAYDFLIEMKQYEENRRRRESSHNQKDYARERRPRRTYSSSSNSVSSRGHRDDFERMERLQARSRSRSV
ncbi:hypothetical protein OSTOST_07317 [Ostertagia ostertagi]